MRISGHPRILRVSEADARRDLAAIIERNEQPLAVIRAPAPERRTISECIALAEAHEKESGEGPGARSGLRGGRGRVRAAPEAVEPADVRLILDSSVVIAVSDEATPSGRSWNNFEGLRRDGIGLSAVTIVELIRGVQRAGTEKRRQRRQASLMS